MYICSLVTESLQRQTVRRQ